MSFYPETPEVRPKPRKRQMALTRLREEIRPEFLKITDPEAVLSISKRELFNQVSYILEEILGRYTFQLSVEEIHDMAQTLTNELITVCKSNSVNNSIN